MRPNAIAGTGGRRHETRFRMLVRQDRAGFGTNGMGDTMMKQAGAQRTPARHGADTT